ncbi:hypothetical protein [Dokdonia pacifica]|uniref:Uncharacterized protein n=1 Tax=Dokdonia pacifica TaxID=1627892 RepID=A0A239CWU8_9FLAO|nr:hypothetical protein [Dokdonia pacifica]SNS24537.1 hypothetical protein SAMN06265376_10918 [Dokdonia pacifica]
MNKTQCIGIGIILIGIAMSFFANHTALTTLAGVLCAIGLGLALKFIPFKKMKS